MKSQDIQKNIDRAVGTKGTLRIPSWWMSKILSDLLKYSESMDDSKAIASLAIELKETDSRISELESRELLLIVDVLPEVGKENTIYLVPSDNGTGNNILTEYAYINGAWEQFGEFKADVDLSSYVKKEDLVNVNGQSLFGTEDNIKSTFIATYGETSLVDVATAVNSGYSVSLYYRPSNIYLQLIEIARYEWYDFTTVYMKGDSMYRISANISIAGWQVEETPLHITPDWAAQEDEAGFIKNKVGDLLNSYKIEIPQTITSNVAKKVTLPESIVGKKIYLKYQYGDNPPKIASLPYGSTDVITFNVGPSLKVSRTNDSLYVKGDSSLYHKLYFSNNLSLIPEIAIPIAIARKTDIPEQVQSNWNEEDESSRAFVQNRTHTITKIPTEISIEDGQITYYLDSIYDSVYLDLGIISSDTYDAIGDWYLRLYPSDSQSIEYGPSDFQFDIEMDEIGDVVRVYFDPADLENHDIDVNEFASMLVPYSSEKLSLAFIPDTIARTERLESLSAEVKRLEATIEEMQTKLASL